jgi:hypothetical protein
MIEVSNAGTVATGEHVNVFRWISVKHMVSLESKGMKSRGGSIRPRIAAELGLKPRDSYEKFIEAIQAKISAVHVAANASEAATKALKEGVQV